MLKFKARDFECGNPNYQELSFTTGKERKGKMRVKGLLVSIIFLLVCMLNVNLAIAAEEIENLSQGGDFETVADKGEWRLNLGNAQATMELDMKEAAIGEGSLYISNIVVDQAANWKPQIDHGSIPILEDGEYTISAFLKGEEAREVGIYVEIPVNPWTKSPNAFVMITEEWEEYWATGLPPGGTVRLGFSNRGFDVPYWIDGVRFYAGEYVPTEIDGQPRIAVNSKDKLSITWGAIKNQ
ncbi:hypothetical protein ACFL6S_32475 [Candidatus Poribacteria bacterium]